MVSDTTFSDIYKPANVIAKGFKELADNSLSVKPTIYRALVIEIDPGGGALEEVPPNPPRSIRARIITNTLDSTLPKDSLTIFWPIFPEHIRLPIKTGEQVYVMFADAGKMQHGLWLWRTPEDNDNQNLNKVDSFSRYGSDESDSPTATFDIDLSSQKSRAEVEDRSDGNEDLIETTPDFIEEEIPSLKSKSADLTFHGNNNSVIIQSVENNSSSAKLTCIVGREDEEPNFDNDAVTTELKESDKSYRIHADKIEVIARKTIDLKSEESSANLQKMILAEDFMNEFKTFLNNFANFLNLTLSIYMNTPQVVNSVSFQTVPAPTTAPFIAQVANFAGQIAQLSGKLDTLLSTKNKNN